MSGLSLPLMNSHYPACYESDDLVGNWKIWKAAGLYEQSLSCV
jgi:hypothetical protein